MEFIVKKRHADQVRQVLRAACFECGAIISKETPRRFLLWSWVTFEITGHNLDPVKKAMERWEKSA